MQSKLPRELRYMVFEHMWDENTFSRYFSSLAHVIGCGCGYHNSVETCNNRVETASLPHFVRPKYVGMPTAYEIVETLYKRWQTRYGTIEIDNIKHIDQVLHTDRFKVKFNPLPVIRGLTLRCKLDFWRQPRVYFNTKKNPPNQVSPREQNNSIKVSQFKPCIEKLLQIQNKKNFDLIFHLTQRNVRLSVLEAALGPIGEIRSGFLAAGATVKVDWAYHGDTLERSLIHDPIIMDLTDAFSDMPSSRWRRQVITDWGRVRISRSFLLRVSQIFQLFLHGKIRSHHVRFNRESPPDVMDGHRVVDAWSSDEDEFSSDDDLHLDDDFNRDIRSYLRI